MQDLHEKEQLESMLDQDLSTKIFVTDESLINEINFCYVSPAVETDIENIQNTTKDNAVLIRGCN